MYYSFDLRKKVIDAVHSKEFTKLQISKFFKISRTTIDKWLQYEKTPEGLFYCKSLFKKSLKIDEEAFTSYINDNTDKYQYEVAKEFGVSQSTVGRTIARLKISRKKNRKNIEKVIK